MSTLSPHAQILLEKVSELIAHWRDFPDADRGLDSLEIRLTCLASSIITAFDAAMEDADVLYAAQELHETDNLPKLLMDQIRPRKSASKPRKITKYGLVYDPHPDHPTVTVLNSGAVYDLSKDENSWLRGYVGDWATLAFVLRS